MDDRAKQQFTCRMLTGKVFRKGKWAVTKEEFPPVYYTEYCQGIMWLLATEQLPRLLQASRLVNFVWVDDFYITGHLARAANITINNIGHHLSIGIYKKKKDLSKIIVWYRFKVVSRAAAWDEVVKYHETHTPVVLR